MESLAPLPLTYVPENAWWCKPGALKRAVAAVQPVAVVGRSSNDGTCLRHDRWGVLMSCTDCSVVFVVLFLLVRSVPLKPSSPSR